MIQFYTKFTNRENKCMVVKSGMVTAYERWNLVNWMDMRGFSGKKWWKGGGNVVSLDWSIVYIDRYILQNSGSLHFIVCKVYLNFFFYIRKKVRKINPIRKSLWKFKWEIMVPVEVVEVVGWKTWIGGCRKELLVNWGWGWRKRKESRITKVRKGILFGKFCQSFSLVVQHTLYPSFYIFLCSSLFEGSSPFPYLER